MLCVKGKYLKYGILSKDITKFPVALKRWNRNTEIWNDILTGLEFNKIFFSFSFLGEAKKAYLLEGKLKFPENIQCFICYLVDFLFWIEFLWTLRERDRMYIFIHKHKVHLYKIHNKLILIEWFTIDTKLLFQLFNWHLESLFRLAE